MGKPFRIVDSVQVVNFGVAPVEEVIVLYHAFDYKNIRDKNLKGRRRRRRVGNVNSCLNIFAKAEAVIAHLDGTTLECEQ